MKMKITLKAFAVSFIMAGSIAHSQFTGDRNMSFSGSGTFWYNYTGSNSDISKLVLDETGGNIYFSGALDNGEFNAMIVKASLDGVLDATLPSGTINYDPYIGLDDRFEAVAVQPNGKMVAAGYSIMGMGNSDIIIARFNTDGLFDPTFNGGSPLLLDAYGGLDFATDVILQDDGKIIVVGSYQISPTDLNLFYLRLNSDGSMDGTFGAGGIQEASTITGTELINSAYVLSTGQIMAIGQSGTDLVMTVLDTDGNLDPTFSGDGILNFKVNSLPTNGIKLIELSDGKLLLAGTTDDVATDGINSFVIKMESNGMFVSNFNGIDGTLNLALETTPGLDTTFTLQDMELLPDGQILLAGDYLNGTNDVGLILVQADGEINTSFGTDGLRLYNLSGGSMPNFNSQIEVTANGAVFLSARVVNGSFEDVVTYKLWQDISGIEEVSSSSLDFTLYPNPTNNELNIQFESETSNDVSIQILDISGRVVALKQSVSVVNGQNTLSLTDEIQDLPSGTYWVRMQSDLRVTSQKFIKF